MFCILGSNRFQYATHGQPDAACTQLLTRQDTSVVSSVSCCDQPVNSLNCCPQSSLLFACENGFQEVADFFLKNGAEVNSQAKPLIEAARNGHIECVKLLLKYGANVNVVDFSGNTALHHFIMYIRPNVMSPKSIIAKRFVLNILLDAGANVNIVNSSGDTPLYLAVKQGLFHIVNGMLSRGGNCTNEEEILDLCKFAFNCCSLELVSGLLFGPSMSTMRRCYPLAMYHSVRNNWLGIVRELLKRGVDVNFMTEAGTPLFAACEIGSVDAARLLLQYGAYPDFATSERIPLLKACEARRCDIAKLLLEHGAYVHATDREIKSALHYAVDSISADDSNPDLSEVNLLLDYGADINTSSSSGETPLYIACSKGLTTTVQRMLKCGAKVDGSKYKKSPLNIACKMKHKALIDLLLNGEADPNIPEETLNSTSYSLHIAAADNNIEFLSLLLNHGANVNVVDFSGNSALHHFMMHIRPNSMIRGSRQISKRYYEVGLDILLKVGADVNIVNSSGETPLYLAVKESLLVAVNKMLSRGGNPNVHDRGKVPLGVACQKKNVRLIKTLVKGGADPNLTTADSESELTVRYELPLCIAVQKGNRELAELLLNRGAKVNVLSPRGQSALQLALEKLTNVYYYRSMQTELDTILMAKLLLEHSADVNQPTARGSSPLSRLIECTVYVGLSEERSVVNEAIKVINIIISNGAILADSKSNLAFYTVQGQLKILKCLCAWRCTDQIVIELFKAGAGFKLLACFYRHHSAVRGVYEAKSVRLCQAVVMAGCRPSKDEIDEFQHSVESGEEVIPQYAQLLSWLNEDRQQAPSLMRQCRVAIRRQLSSASCYRTILPAIDQLPLPRSLQQYLKFEGCYTEVDI